MVQDMNPARIVESVARDALRLLTSQLTDQEREQLLDSLVARYGDVTDIRHPLDPRGDVPIRSRAALREHFAHATPGAHGSTEIALIDPVMHHTGDPEVVVFEFSYAGMAGGKPFSLPCVVVERVRDGEIIESRHYGDHVAFARLYDPQAD